MLKRAFDLVVSAILLGTLSPLLLIIALANRLTSPGPIFYRAARVGRYGRCLKIYKFRTMVVNADKVGPAITTAGDPRITPVGRILRKTKLDELPQLINVLKGEMSLVGPRPEDPRYVALYSPVQREVLRVRPGITSPASVRFRHEEAILCGQDWEDRYIHEVLPIKLAIDLDYARRASLWLDIEIMFRTFVSLWNMKPENATPTAKPLDTAQLANMPFVSVIMPVHNEADAIPLSLRAVLRQDYPHERMEIIIADGMSTDTTRLTIDSILKYYPDIPVTILDNPGKIVHTGLNVALAKARGDIIIRVDGHREIARNYVTHCVDEMLAKEADGVGRAPLSQPMAVGMNSSFGVSRFAFRTVQDKAVRVNRVAQRQAIEKAARFDDELVRDQGREHHAWQREPGGKVFLNPDIRSQYHSQRTIRPLWWQYFQYSYWKVRVMAKSPQQMSLPLFVPSLFVGTALTGGLFAAFSRTFHYLWLTGILFYTVANLGVSLAISHKHGWRHLLLLPVAFMTRPGLCRFALKESRGKSHQ